MFIADNVIGMVLDIMMLMVLTDRQLSSWRNIWSVPKNSRGLIRNANLVIKLYNIFPVNLLFTDVIIDLKLYLIWTYYYAHVHVILKMLVVLLVKIIK